MLPWYGTDTYASSAADFSTLVAEANKDGKILLANEHGLNVLKQDLMLAIGRGETLPDVGANPTAIPNSLYQQLQPLILIRNPLLQVPSSYTVSLRANQMRPGDEDFHNTTTLRFSRYLYDHFTSQGRQPIVVDGEDVLWRTKEVAEAVCGRLGLSAEGVRDVWEPSEMEGYGLGQPMIRAYMADILDSRGVVRPDVKVSVWGCCG